MGDFLREAKVWMVCRKSRGGAGEKGRALGDVEDLGAVLGDA